MKEHIVNVFLFTDDGIIREIGSLWYCRDGTDEEKIAFLQSAVSHFKLAVREAIPKWCMMVKDGRTERGAILHESFNELLQSGMLWQLMEETVFQHCTQAPRNPLMVITPVVDGTIRVESVLELPEAT